MVDVQVLYPGTTAVVTAVFAVAVLSGNHRKSSNLFLASFLLLIAGNQGLVAVARAVSDLALQAVLFDVAFVFAALDPFFLYYFVSLYPERNVLNETPYVTAVGGGALLLAVAGAVWTFNQASWIQVSRIVYTAVVYSVALGYVARRVLTSEEVPGRRALFYALLAATLPLWPAPVHRAHVIGVNQGWIAGIEESLLTSRVLLVYTTILVGFGVSVWVARRWIREGGGDDRLRRNTYWAVGLATLLSALMRSRFLFNASRIRGWWDPATSEALASAAPHEFGAALRWLTFSVFASTAVLRHDMLGMSLKARRRGARALTGLAFLLGAAGLLAATQAALGETTLQLSGTDVVVLGLVLVASQRFQTLIDRVAQTVYGVPMPEDPQAALQAYKAALEQAREEGRGREDPELVRLRHELDLEESTVKMLEEAVFSSPPEPVRAGGTVAGRYHVGRKLDQGALGEVFLAKDRVLERDVVLKEVELEDQPLEDVIAREAKVTGQLQHPNVLTVHDAIERPESMILVTEFAAGGTLEEMVGEEGPLPVDRGLELVGGVLAGLQAAHEEDVVHRDVKPANVLLTADGRPMIGDFGVARIREGGTTIAQTAEVFAGTPEYMAPEQKLGKVATEASDIYAVGLIMDRCLQELPQALDRVKQRALAEDPRDRWPSAAEMRAALEAAQPRV